MKTQTQISCPRVQSAGEVDAQVHELTPMQKLLLQAPTWSDEDYKNYLERRQHFNRSCTQLPTINA